MPPEYRDTLNLPRTPFEMRAGLSEKEPLRLAQWARDDLWGAIGRARAGAPRFVVHDGPPYANGQLHHGHILNKVLKDIVVRDRTMAGFDVSYIPGWDCHGLPIEAQVERELGAARATMDTVAVRAACRAYAARMWQAQRAQFQRLGVLGSWQRPYLTMDPAYQAATLRELAQVVRAGLLYKGLRPVNWCTRHQTALAEAEVEYEEKRSPSAYVAFAAHPDARLPADTDFVIWTTTPWTLPANLAIAVNPELEYVGLRLDGRVRIVARALAGAFLAACGHGDAAVEEVAHWRGAELVGARYRHVTLPRDGTVLAGAHVTAAAGTGCVHTAPGHGGDDFELGRRHGLEVLSPVDARGVLTAAAGEFAGLRTHAANPAILAALQARGALLGPADATVSHRTAHCWRCHEPIILRATEQWFMAMDRPYAGGAALRARALAALPAVTWTPAWGIDRIRGMLAGRPDWCLSRQRRWGVPIAVCYCTACATPLLDADALDEVATAFAAHGADVWWTRPLAELMRPRACGHCGGRAFRKEQDVLDVWFDSGVSCAAVVEARAAGQPDGAPVDLYLEGSDQHRGWFHASLLCGLATRGRAPYRAVLTHGFVVDGQGRKISKSRGNFVDPFTAIARDGAEILRLWAAAEDYREDIRISPEILRRLADAYRKVRNTVRFLLGNLADFDPDVDMVAAFALPALEAQVLARAQAVAERVQEAYAAYQFHLAQQALGEWCALELSAFFLDVRKDCLYADAAAAPARRAAQTVLYLVARDLLRLLAPILCFTAEEAWELLPRLAGDPSSVHLARYPGAEEPPGVAALRAAAAARAADDAPAFAALREARQAVNAALETARRERVVGASTAARVTLTHAPAALAALDDATLATLFIVAAVRRVDGGSGAAAAPPASNGHAAPGTPHAPATAGAGGASPMTVHIDRADGDKCARCWRVCTDVGAAAAHPTLCQRCVAALGEPA